MTFTYGSVCSGIEAASVAWEPLGFKPAWFAEIEAFPAAVLAHRWPEVNNLGDMTKIASQVRAGVIEAPSMLVGGTPCQAFSVAGARLGLADERGQLTISYGELADAIDETRLAAGKHPAIIVWENVPGVLSSKDNAFGALLGLLAGEECELVPPGDKWKNAGYVHGPQRTVAWRILDAQYFGVAQRRRRVFVVASARKDIDPAKILFERDSVRRDFAPSRGARPEAAGTTGRGVKVGSPWDNPVNPHPTLNQSHNVGGIGQSNQELFSQRGSGIIAMAHGQGGAEIKTDDSAPTLTCNHEAPIVVKRVMAFQPCDLTRAAGAAPSEQVFPTLKSDQGRGTSDQFPHVVGVAFTVSLRGREGGATAELGDEVATCLRASTGGGDKPHVLTAFAFAENSRAEVRLENGDGQIAGALTTGGGKAGQGYPAVVSFQEYGRANEINLTDYRTMAVRRLTPVECERLQGFPDNHTLIPVEKRKKITEEEYAYLRHHNPNMTAEEAYRLAADGPRYKAIGNSMAVPVMRWIGERIMSQFARNTLTEDAL